MTIRKIISKSETALKPTQQVDDFHDQYIRQAVQDLLDTLEEKQRRLDLQFPDAGGGVGLAANQIEYPYQPHSDDETPKNGFYPKNFIPPNIYVISIRQKRAKLENCDVVRPSVYINATFEPLDQIQSFYEEACLSLEGFKGFHIPRYQNIKIHAYDEEGREVHFLARDFIARVHQHELDHSLGQEYLNQINFNEAELEKIYLWINQNQHWKLAEHSGWIIQNKLRYTDPHPDFKALKKWVLHEISKRAEDQPFYSRKKYILGTAAFALLGFSLFKCYQDDAAFKRAPSTSRVQLPKAKL